jgi:hypothetical protein
MSENIVCPHDSSHSENVIHSVICSQCNRPLFKVKWWYHAVFLNLSLFAIGFIIGEFKNLWIPGLIIELLFLIYLCILFRKTRDNLFFVAILFVVSLLTAFLVAYGDFGSGLLAFAIAILPYIVIAILFVTYSFFWLVGATFFVGKKLVIHLIKGFPALSLGWFLILLIVDWINDQGNFLDRRVVSIIKSHIHLRWILLGISVGWLIVLAFTKSLEKETDLRKVFLNPITHVEPWAEDIKREGFLGAILSVFRPVINITLTIYKSVTQVLKAIANFIIYLVLLGLLWLKGFLLQCIKVTRDTILLFRSAFWDFLRFVALPLVVLFVMHSALLNIPIPLFNHIHAIETGDGFLRFFLDITMFGSLSVLLILMLGKFDKGETVEVAKSLMLTNLAVGFMILLYAWTVSITLWAVAQWLPESPFHSIGSFPFIIGVLVLIVGFLIFGFERFKSK